MPVDNERGEKRVGIMYQRVPGVPVDNERGEKRVKIMYQIVPGVIELAITNDISNNIYLVVSLDSHF